MTAIEKIKERIEKYPDLKYVVSRNEITIESSTPNGFSVSLFEDIAEWIVHFDGWHENFDKEDEALNCFAFGLSDDCRLEIALRGNFPYRWTVQHKTKNGWESESTTGLIFFPFWRRKRVEYRHNGVLKGT